MANNVGGGTGAFSTTPVTWTLTITDTGVLASLENYINNGGDIALGLDADCHFSDTSIQFQILGIRRLAAAAVRNRRRSCSSVRGSPLLIGGVGNVRSVNSA